MTIDFKSFIATAIELLDKAKEPYENTDIYDRDESLRNIGYVSAINDIKDHLLNIDSILDSEVK